MKSLRLSLHLLSAALLVPVAVSAQQSITGRVVNAETLQPLSGVEVGLVEADVRTLTNSNGSFSIAAPANGTLIFTLLGYAQITEAIAGRTSINVSMSASAIMLDEIVAVGYATQTRATVSGAVSSLSTEQLQSTSESSITDMMVGKMAGINTRLITTPSNNSFGGREPQDGRPGSASVLQIRNLGEPLYVIDGIPQTALEFNQLNSNDIDNISILKDASASVYGFRAANGVVLVTTKKGSPLRSPQIRLDMTAGWQNLARSRSPFGYGNTALQFMYSRVESEQNRGLPRTITQETLDNYRQGAPGFESYEAWNYVINNPNAFQGNFNASISGGAEEAQYYLSLGHITQDYVMKDNNFNRSNFQANLQTGLFGGVTVGTELRGRLEKHITTAITNTSTQNNIGDPMTVYFQSIQSTWPFEDPYANGNPDYPNGDVRYFVRSPVVFTRDRSGTQDQIRRNFTGNFWAEYEAPWGTKVRGTYSMTSDIEEFDVHRFTFNGYCYDETADAYNICPGGNQNYNDPSRRHLRGVRESSFGNINVTQSLDFGDHSVTGVGVFEMSSGEGTTTEVFAIPPTNFTPLIDYVDVRNAETSWSVNRRASFAGRLNYDYKDKYLVEALGRYDGSYLYAPDNRWGFFPGVTLGWRLTEEPFIQDLLPFMNELKLRASWGQSGSETGQAWAYLGGATYGNGAAVFDGTVETGIQPRGIPVTELSWVTATTRNIGVDFALLDQKLGGEIDFFERKRTGLPAARYDVVLPSEVGYSLPDENLESDANLGMDAIIRYNDRIGEVSFSIAPNVTLARQKVLEQYKPRYENSWDEYRTADENRWANYDFNYHVSGQFQTMEEIARHTVDIDGQGNTTLLPGDLIFQDENGDGIINALDQRPRGFETTGTPILSFGLNGSFSWAGASLNYNFAGGALYSFNPSRDLRVPYTSDHNGGAYIWSRWRRADPYDDNSEWIPGKFPPLRRAQNSHSSYRDSDFTYTNVKFIRLRNVELSYTLPADLASRFSLANLRVYTSAANPWLLDNAHIWAQDPEVSQCCGQLYPTPTTYSVGFSAALGGQPRVEVAIPVPSSGDD